MVVIIGLFPVLQGLRAAGLGCESGQFRAIKFVDQNGTVARHVAD